MHVRQVQRHLVASVWYGKRSPYGDIPVRILDHGVCPLRSNLPTVYLGSSHTPTPEFVREYNIDVILRLGWGFKDLVPPDEVLPPPQLLLTHTRAL